MALLLLSWMRLRKALRSPGLGFLTGTILDFFLKVRLVFLGRSLRDLIVGGGAAAKEYEVEKNAARGRIIGWMRGAAMGIDGLTRPRRQEAADAMMINWRDVFSFRAAVDIGLLSHGGQLGLALSWMCSLLWSCTHKNLPRLEDLVFCRPLAYFSLQGFRAGSRLTSSLSEKCPPRCSGHCKPRLCYRSYRSKNS
jgi:hypothetical protein